MKPLWLTLLLTIAASAAAPAGDGARTLTNIAYKANGAGTDYERERCRLDLYLPSTPTRFATLVWFHGGGLKEGTKEGAGTVKIARSLAAAGLGVVVPNYRLSPKAIFPAYVQDAAAAVAWALAQIAAHGGDPRRVFVGGHSAGGYLTLMLGMDPRYLRELGVEPSALAGLIPVSGQTLTHYTVREERGIGRFTVTADEAAPVHFARKDTPPFLVLYADRDMAARAEENAYFVALLKGAGNERVVGRLIADRDHGSVAHRIAETGDPAREALLQFIREQSATR